MTAWLVTGAVGLLGLVYVYGGYLTVLRILVHLTGARPVPPALGDDAHLPGITVFFSAFNEAPLVRRRLDNLLAQNYPADRLEIFVVSDGSTDGTAAQAEAFAGEHPETLIRVRTLATNTGRHAAQNLVAKEARNEILVATDADSEFSPGFLRAVGPRFLDPKVGVVGGVIQYRPAASDIAASIGTYRAVEYRLRAAEQRLGILAKTDGPCTAYRRKIWREIEEFEDVDHVIVIFARQAGMVAVQAEDAVCWDTPNTRWRQELSARARMTRKGLFSIHKRWGWRDVRREPLFSWALYSHRHARYASPLFLALVLTAAFGTALAIGVLSALLVAGAGAAALMAGAWVFDVGGPRRLVGTVRSFLVANAGFARGIWGWLRQDRAGRYRPARHGVDP